MKLAFIKILVATALAGSGSAVSAAGNLPFVVNSEAFEIRDNGHLKSCGVMIIANSIDGEFISSVIKLNVEGEGYETEYIISTGTVEYRTGSETFDYVEEAWLQTEYIETRSKSVAGRGPDIHAYKGVYTERDSATLYKSLFEETFIINMITHKHADVFPYKVDDAFDQFTQQSAHGCIREILREP